MKDKIQFKLFISEFTEKIFSLEQFINFFPLPSIASGVQTAQHAHPGRSFFAVGFPRTCYIPDCPLGRKVFLYHKLE